MLKRALAAATGLVMATLAGDAALAIETPVPSETREDVAILKPEGTASTPNAAAINALFDPIDRLGRDGHTAFVIDLSGVRDASDGACNQFDQAETAGMIHGGRVVLARVPSETDAYLRANCSLDMEIYSSLGAAINSFD